MGWQLPRARRFDGGETTLYLETIFPLLYVEQKAGWSSMPAAFPNYIQIRDVGRRAIEFLMGLNTHDLELRRQKLELDLAASNSAWAAKRAELQSVAALANARIQGIPSAPTVSLVDIEEAFLLAPFGDEWRPLDDIMSALRSQVADMRSSELPDVEDMSASAAEELDRAMETAAAQNANRNALFRARQADIVQLASVQRRIAALEEDLQKNLDAQKLRNFGSKITETFAADHCPTCSQPIQDTLLAQQASAAVMPVEDNIEYIRSQRAIFLRLKAQVEAAIASTDQRLAAATAEVNETNSRLRALRADLTSPSHAPSIAMLEARLRAEARLEALEDVQQRFEQHKVALIALATRHAELLWSNRDFPLTD
jgi:DNA repair exonuclease SbcCD ATPase subunit